ncbi:Uncharacterised protein [Yersinia pekkanenii]|uniref:Uncharacterized protein n=1 Tax=Yersinia pekkanenii TaxID=1288385 RepID=A0A0T9R5V7_9GAMM|nr:Uncharacterised protein [Yersinia pekkanenii]CRY65727.1 Uncharacterised protein [Yersinia pekkanenii]
MLDAAPSTDGCAASPRYPSGLVLMGPVVPLAKWAVPEPESCSMPLSIDDCAASPALPLCWVLTVPAVPLAMRSVPEPESCSMSPPQLMTVLQTRCYP